MTTHRHGYFGEFGGQFMPETLMNAIIELEAAYEMYKNDPEFIKELVSIRSKTLESE